MDNVSFTITAINMHLAKHEWLAIALFEDQMQAEAQPGYPPVTLEEIAMRWGNTPANFEPFGWIVRQDDAIASEGANPIVGYAAMVLERPAGGALANFALFVLPEVRRRGLGRRLMTFVAERARHESRDVLWVATHDTIPAGRVLLEKIGGTLLSRIHVNQLDVTRDLDPVLIDQWQTSGQAANPDFEILFCDAWLTDDQCSILAEAEHGIYNPDTPFASLDANERLRMIEGIRGDNQAASGIERSVAFIKQKNSVIYAGCTIVRWDKNHPELLAQGSTGILREFRRRGLGRWLKAAMLQHCIERHADLRYVRTTNADRNEAILAINTAMGFKPFLGECRWQVETKQLLDYVVAPE